ncbi:hypothetical protein AWB79_01923 [Caballeronia hypogeia]|uniref:Uncharacterized protein n=2 Tax=Caballeronia hypogeia TaxID=1777140 RepID=A0A158A4L9_9BURK|nr:hypothetical protein AWB79_01923 [Caballeronia hypogeia]
MEAWQLDRGQDVSGNGTRVYPGNAADNAASDCKHGLPVFDSIQRFSGAGEHPAAIVSFDLVEAHVLRTFQSRIHHRFSKNRTLVVQVMPDTCEA